MHCHFLFIVFLCAELMVTSVSALKLPTYEPVQEQKCDDVALIQVSEMFFEGQYEKLRGHQCLDEEMHPHDAGEIVTSKQYKQFVEGCKECQERLPSLMYLGVGHSGSTTIANHMNLHPQLSYGATKEHRFFTSYTQSSTKSLADYRKGFIVPPEVKHTFDATPNTLWLGQDSESYSENFCCFGWRAPGKKAIEELRDTLPAGKNLKFIVMVRDPFYFQLSLASAQTKHPSYPIQVQPKACYGELLKHWLDVFPKQNFLFLKSEQFFQDPQETLDRIFEFADVDPFKLSHDQLYTVSGRRRNSRKVNIPEQEYKAFSNSPRSLECKQLLVNLTGLSLDW